MNRTRMAIPRKKGYFSLILFCFGILLVIQTSLSFSQEKLPSKEEDVLSPYALIGVVVSKDALSAVAVFKNNETGETVRRSVGESILGMEIIQIANDGILIKKGAKIYWNLLKERDQTISAESAQQKQDKVAATNQEQLLVINNQVGVSLPEREYDRADIEKRVERERLFILKEMNVIPNYLDGKIAGFKVTRLPKTGVASEVGLYEGDVIKEVNGVKLDSLSAVIGFYGRIYTEDRFEFLIERNGKLVRQAYILK